MRSGKQSQGPDLLRADMEYTASRQTDNITGFRKVKGGQKCVSSWNTTGSYGIPRKMVRVVVGIYGGFECAVIDGWEISDWFKILSRVKQGCVMSRFLFLLAMDWIMRKTTARH